MSYPPRDLKFLGSKEHSPQYDPNKEATLRRLSAHIALDKFSPRKPPQSSKVLHDYRVSFAAVEKHSPALDLSRLSGRTTGSRSFSRHYKINYLKQHSAKVVYSD